MSSDPFQQAIAFTLRQEGGWSDNPADPGHATMRGITLSVFRAWRHNPGAKPEELRAISASEVEAIYRGLYWNPVHGSQLPPGVGLAVFDAAVNLGVRRAAMLLQSALGVAQDGVIGPETLSATLQDKPEALLEKVTSEREAFYGRCGGFSIFGRGWLTRNHACFIAGCRVARLSVEEDQARQGPMTGLLAPISADSLNAEELVKLNNIGLRQMSSG